MGLVPSCPPHPKCALSARYVVDCGVEILPHSRTAGHTCSLVARRDSPILNLSSSIRNLCSRAESQSARSASIYTPIAGELGGSHKHNRCTNRDSLVSKKRGITDKRTGAKLRHRTTIPPRSYVVCGANRRTGQPGRSILQQNSRSASRTVHSTNHFHFFSFYAVVIGTAKTAIPFFSVFYARQSACTPTS